MSIQFKKTNEGQKERMKKREENTHSFKIKARWYDDYNVAREVGCGDEAQHDGLIHL